MAACYGAANVVLRYTGSVTQGAGKSNRSQNGCKVGSCSFLGTSDSLRRVASHALRASSAGQSTHALKMRCQAAGAALESAGVEAMLPKTRHVGRGSRMIGTGSAIPSREISNELLSTIVETNDEWIATRTGIRTRRVLSGDETLSSLAIEAAIKAMNMAQVQAADIDLVILCTSTPDDIFGGACQIQAALGCKKAVAFDLTAACSGFVMGMVTASRFITGGGYENVLVIGADALSRYVDWTDRGTCILFGDGCGALVMRATVDGEESGLLGFDMRSDGAGSRHLHAHVGTSKEANGAAVAAAAPEGGAEDKMVMPSRAVPSFIYMNGKEVFRFAVKAVPQVVEGALQEAGLSPDKLDWLLLHQANQRILDSVADKVGISHDKVISNLANYGNTSAASIPLALDEAVRSGKVQAGHVVATAGFGAGLSWAGAIFRWG